MRPLSGDDPVQIGRYRLHNLLGVGGMGKVYLASTPAGRPVALKVVRPELSDDQEFRARFQQEILAARRVRGLYTAELVDADPDADPPWLATAYVPGPSLQQVLDERGPMPEAEAFRLIAGMAEALQAIHAANVVHRDLKPSNVVLGPDGPRVIDFGIARALEGGMLTRTGMTVGTPQFMAPEQLMELPVTPMIDIFALGSLAAYAVLGRPPFGGRHAAAVSYRVVHEPPDLDGCPPTLRALIEQCLAKEPADRPQLDQILQFCLEHADVAAVSMPAQAPPLYQSAEMATSRKSAALPAVTAGVAPQSPQTGMPSRVVPPQPIIKAVRLIYLGSLLTLGGIAVNCISALPVVRTALNIQDGVDKVTVAGAVITGLAAAAVWLWMARGIKRGWSKARLTGTCLFVINTVAILANNAGGISDYLAVPFDGGGISDYLTLPFDAGEIPNYLAFLFDLAQWGVGLLALLALWNRRSGTYFAELDRVRSFAIPEWPKKAAPQASGPRHVRRLQPFDVPGRPGERGFPARRRENKPGDWIRSRMYLLPTYGVVRHREFSGTGVPRRGI
jgi:hypothetical protein